MGNPHTRYHLRLASANGAVIKQAALYYNNNYYCYYVYYQLLMVITIRFAAHR